MRFLPCNFAKKKIQKRFLHHILILQQKTQFYLKTWCVVKMLIQHLTRCKNVHSKTHEVWKCLLEDSLVMKTLVRKLFSFLDFFPRFTLFKEALNCRLWGFYRVIFKKEFSESSFATEFEFIKKHTSSWKLDAL